MVRNICTCGQTSSLLTQFLSSCGILQHCRHVEKKEILFSFKSVHGIFLLPPKIIISWLTLQGVRCVTSANNLGGAIHFLITFQNSRSGSRNYLCMSLQLSHGLLGDSNHNGATFLTLAPNVSSADLLLSPQHLLNLCLQKTKIESGKQGWTLHAFWHFEFILLCMCLLTSWFFMQGFCWIWPVFVSAWHRVSHLKNLILCYLEGN